jgi:hypothetical protein
MLKQNQIWLYSEDSLVFCGTVLGPAHKFQTSISQKLDRICECSFLVILFFLEYISVGSRRFYPRPVRFNMFDPARIEHMILPPN